MMIGQTRPDPAEVDSDPVPGDEPVAAVPEAPPAGEVGGRDGLDPVRYGDWEKNGRCIDF